MKKLAAFAGKFHQTIVVLTVCSLAALTETAFATDYYVATYGNDSNLGTSTNASGAWATLAHAVSTVSGGDVVYMRGGTYATSSQISMTKIGSSASRYTVTNFPGEVPTLNCTGESGSSEGIRITGAYWQLFGLVITNAAHNGINIRGGTTAMMGSFNRIERCTVVGNRDSGVLIGSNSGTFTALPSSNTVLNCDAMRNFDSPGGGNADGFSAKWACGPGNVFRGCRAWENSDDGWDLWMAPNPILIDTCWTWRNGSNVFASGSFAGNGNGFKLGGNNIAGAHRLVRSLAYQNVGNGGYGIDENNNTGVLTVDQNTSWANKNGDINLNHSPNTNEHHIIRNNVAFAGVTTNSVSTLISNSWQLISSPAVNSNDFVSMDASLLAAPRQADGSLPVITLVHPVPNGRLVDKGCIVTNNFSTPPVVESFNGTAPDLGAFETAAGGAPVAAFTGTPTGGTAPLAVTFTDSSTGSITNRLWNFGDGNTTNFTVSANPVHTYNAGTYTVSLTVSGTGGTNTLTRSNYIVATNPAPPVASFTGAPTNGATPLAVTFTDSSTGSITNRFWNFGDGNTSNTTVTTMNHTYSAGTYTVTLTAGGLGGTNTLIRSNYIVAVDPPVAKFTASPTSGTEPLTVTFTDISTGTSPLSLSWNLGDSTTTNTAGAASLGHSYAAGVYTVTLTASNSAGISTLVSNNLIQVVTVFQAWQQQYFSCTNCPQANADADPDGDGQNNQAEFLAGTDPTNSLSGLRIISTAIENDNIRIIWTTSGGHTNVVQAGAGDGDGGYSTNFTDIGDLIVITGNGDTVTNYLDVGAATNVPAQYYRIRLAP